MLNWLFGKSPPKRVFTFGSKKDTLTPRELGCWSVKWAIDSTISSVEAMYETPERAELDTLRSRIFKAPGFAHRCLFLYSMSAYYTYTLMILKAPKDVLAEVFDGFEEGLSIQKYDGVPLSSDTVQVMLNIVRRYAQGLYTELSETKLETTGFSSDSGTSAAMVFKDIVLIYDPDQEVDVDRLDEIEFGYNIAIHGVMHIASLRDELKLGFNP